MSGCRYPHYADAQNGALRVFIKKNTHNNKKAPVHCG